MTLSFGMLAVDYAKSCFDNLVNLTNMWSKTDDVIAIPIVGAGHSAFALLSFENSFCS